jgi:hypothetical protein
MNAFSVMGPNAASWKPVEGKHASIFGVDESFGNGSATGATMTGADVSSSVSSSGGNMLLNADLAAATNALRNVTITKVRKSIILEHLMSQHTPGVLLFGLAQATLLQSYNTFGVPLGVSVSCLPKNEVVDTGDKYTFTTIPNTAVNTPSTLYEAGDTHAQAMEWMRNYGKFNAGNLRTTDVLRVSGSGWLLSRTKQLMTDMHIRCPEPRTSLCTRTTLSSTCCASTRAWWV